MIVEMTFNRFIDEMKKFRDSATQYSYEGLDYIYTWYENEYPLLNEDEQYEFDQLDVYSTWTEYSMEDWGSKTNQERNDLINDCSGWVTLSNNSKLLKEEY